MIVSNTGYLKLEQVIEMALKKDHFSLYKTHKDTIVLVRKTDREHLQLCSPKKDRLPYKIVEGKKIARATRIFNSLTDDISNLQLPNQIMSYQEFTV